MKRGLAIWVLLFAFAGMAAAASRLKPGDRIVTLGDSITQAGAYQAIMQKVFDRFYPDLRIEIVNAGIGGHKSTDMSARLQRMLLTGPHGGHHLVRRQRCVAWLRHPPRGVDSNRHAADDERYSSSR